MRLFRTRSREWCEEALEALEEAVASGANSTSFQGQSVSWKTLAEAESIAHSLYLRISELDGKRRRRPISYFSIVTSRGL